MNRLRSLLCVEYSFDEQLVSWKQGETVTLALSSDYKICLATSLEVNN